MEKDDSCLDSGCWGKKVRETLERKIVAAQERFGDELIIVGHKGEFKLTKSKLLDPWNYVYSHEEERPEGYVPVVMLHSEGKLAWARARNDEAARQKQAEANKRDEERRKREEKLRQATAADLQVRIGDVVDDLPILRMLVDCYWGRCYGKPQAIAKKAFGIKSKDSLEVAAWSRENLLKLIGILVIAKDAEGWIGPAPYKSPEKSVRIAAAFGLDYEATRKACAKVLDKPAEPQKKRGAKPKREKSVATEEGSEQA